MKKKGLIAFSTVAVLFVVIELFTFSREAEKYPFTIIFKDFKISPDINFCGEPVPFQSDDIRERFDREILKNAYWQSETIMYFKRAKRWFPVIEPILKQYGLPDDLKYVAIIESGLVNVVSPAGATGFWQIMERTGKEYGMEIREEVDDRYDVEKSTHAACKYFRSAYRKFKSYTAAAASYNMGMGGLASKMEEQGVNSYYDLLLNTETSRYVFRILSYKEIFNNPKYYGYDPENIDGYPPYDVYSVKVDSTIPDLMRYALSKNSNYKILKTLNPWLREKRLTVRPGTSYTIKLPKSGIYQYEELFAPAADTAAVPLVSDSTVIDITAPNSGKE
ncbi:MAG: transglycosylase SLT domain-containing protein [Flavobacteriales bacterium]